MNLFEKSRPPVSRPSGGMRISFTSDLTIPPKAAPMITPTARSTALPFDGEFFEFLKHGIAIILGRDDVDKLLLYHHDLANCLPGGELPHALVGQRNGLKFGLRSRRLEP